jgi:hypothetical protein
MNYNKEHRKLQRQHQRDLLLAAILVALSLACIGGGIGWVIYHVWLLHR